MAKGTTRSYDGSNRQAQAQQANNRILTAAKKLFEVHGFESVTIDAIASKAKVSKPTVYAKFKSKRGILLAIIDSALADEERSPIVEAIYASSSAHEQLQLTAKICRKVYDAEYQKMEWARGAAIIDPVFKKLEQQQEERRYQRQKKTVDLMAKQGALTNTLTKIKVRDILWAFTGRDFYRMLVIERGWSSNQYETWLASQLITTLLG